MQLRPSRHSLPLESRTALVDLLNERLADLADLRSQVKEAHWNLRGPRFIALHEFFDKLAAELLEPVDAIAERATALGGFARGTIRLAGANSALPELPEKAGGDLEFVTLLADRYAATSALFMASITRAQEHKCEVTADLFIGITAYLDKSLWFLESHLDS